MKFVLDLGGKSVLLSNEQLDKLWDLVHGAEIMDEKWVGSNKGTTGPSKDYVPIIKTFEAHKELALKMISQEQIDAIKFCMKQQEQ